MSFDVSIELDELAPWPSDPAAILESLRTTVLSGDWSRHVADVNETLIKDLSTIFQCKHVHLCSSGTAAIDLALRATNVQPDSEVIIAGYDYPGNIRAVEAIGARPVIVDTQPNRWTIDLNAVEQAISSQTSAIIASHIYGNLFEAKALRDLTDRNGLTLIEDACQAHGAVVDGKPAGSWGAVGVLSFGPSKLMTAGCGGALLMSDDRIAQRACNLSQRPGVVAPMSPLQAAALIPQLASLAHANTQRRNAVEMLNLLLRDSQVWLSSPTLPHEKHTPYFTVAWFLKDAETRDLLVNSVQSHGLPVGRGFNGFLKRAKRNYRTIGSLPHSERCLSCSIVLDQRVLLSSEETIRKVARLLFMLEGRVEDKTEDIVDKR